MKYLWRTSRMTGGFSTYRPGDFVRVLAGDNTPFLVTKADGYTVTLATGRLVNLLYATWGRYREWRAKQYMAKLRGTP